MNTPRVLLLSLLAAGALRAEMGFPGNPALPERFDGLRSNPALAGWQPLAFGADWQLLNSGLAGGAAAFSQGGFQLAVPRLDLALLGDLRESELLSENELTLAWAFRPRADLSLGVEGGVRRFGWDRDALGAGSANDPVFREGSDRLQPVLGLGAYWAPRPWISAGLGLKHLNRPSLSLVGDEVRAPARAYLGVAWRLRGVTLGATVDNLSRQTASSDLGDDLAHGLKPSLQVSWRPMAELGLHADLRSQGMTMEFAARPGGPHEIAYAYTLPLGDLAERSEGSHRLAYRHDLGGALAAGRMDGRAVLLPGSPDGGEGGWLDALRRRWRPEKAPLHLASATPALEVVELHVHVEPALLERLRELGADPAALAAAGLGGAPGGSAEPERSGVVEGTWSAGWWRLSGWLEQLAFDEGVRPVIHVGKERERVEDLANLLGAELDVQGLPRLPATGRLARPDSLRLDVRLPGELARLADRWTLTGELPGQGALSLGGAGLPERLALPLDGDRLQPGEAVVGLTVLDRRGRPLALRELRIPVHLRVRHAHLREAEAGSAPPAGVDGVRILLDENE